MTTSVYNLVDRVGRFFSNLSVDPTQTNGDAELALHFSDQAVACHLQNMQFRIQVPLPAGSMLRMRLSLPGTEEILVVEVESDVVYALDPTAESAPWIRIDEDLNYEEVTRG